MRTYRVEVLEVSRQQNGVLVKARVGTTGREVEHLGEGFSADYAEIHFLTQGPGNYPVGRKVFVSICPSILAEHEPAVRDTGTEIPGWVACSALPDRDTGFETIHPTGKCPIND